MTTRITLGELPARARRPDGSALANVFGGCLEPGATCTNSIDCCSQACVSQTISDPLGPPRTVWYCKHPTMGGF